MDKLAFGLFLLFVLIYIIALTTTLITAYPWGLIGLLPIVGFGILFMKVVQDRLNNEEDDYYSKNIKQ